MLLAGRILNQIAYIAGRKTRVMIVPRASRQSAYKPASPEYGMGQRYECQHGGGLSVTPAVPAGRLLRPPHRTGETFLLVMRNLPDKDQCISHKNARKRNQPDKCIDPKRLIEQQQRGTTPTRPAGQSEKPSPSPRDRTCTMMISNVRAIIIGNNGTMA